MHSLYSGSKRAAHINETDMDMDMDMDMDIGDKSVYIRAFWPREISQPTNLSRSKVIT